MISFGNKRWLVSFGATVAIALVGATLSSACKPKGGKSTAAAAASGSASAKTGPELSAGCQEYIDKLCEKVGKQSPTCQEMTKSAELMSDAVCSAAKRDIKFTTDKLAEKRKTCDTLVTRLCGELGKTTETCKMVETHTKNFPPERCKMMLERYPEVLADLKRMEEANKPLSAEKQALIANGENVPSFGPADAKATLVEFSDFQCPFCSKGANTLTEIKKKYAGKVRVVFRQFPLSFHDKAHVAAEAALAANAQGKFWEFHDKMFANQSALDRAALEKYAAEVGLKVDVFKKALDDKTYAAPVDADMKLGTDVGVQGTPSMFLNGKKVQNPTDADSVAKMIDEALKG